MFLKYYLSGFLIFVEAIAFAQPSIAWQKCYGGSNFDFFEYAVNTGDGGIITSINSGSEDGDLTGIINSSGWVIKFDSFLNIEWQRFYSDDSYESAPIQPICLANGDYFFGGIGGDGCVNYHGLRDIYLLRTSSNGDTLWSRCLGSPGVEEFSNIIHTQDNGFLITGSSWSSGGDIPFHHGDLSTDAIVFKIDSVGNLQWLKVLGGSSYDSPLANPVEISRGKYLIHLYSASNDFDLADCPVTDFKKRWIIVMDSLGNIVKESFMSAEDDLYSFDGTLLIDGDNTIIIGTGSAESTLFPAPAGHAGEEGAIAVFDSTLTMTGMYLFGGSGSDRFERCIKDTNGNFYLLGYSNSKNYNLPDNYNDGEAEDYWIIKLNDEYNVLWSKNFGGSHHSGDLANTYFNGSLLQLSNLLYVFSGAVTPQALPDFDIECGHIIEDPGLNVFQDAWIVAFDLSTAISNLEYSSFSIYPNPCNDFLHINSNQIRSNYVTIDLYSIAGNKVYEKKLEINETVINVSQIAPALYILEIKQENKPSEYFKIIIN